MKVFIDGEITGELASFIVDSLFEQDADERTQAFARLVTIFYEKGFIDDSDLEDILLRSDFEIKDG